MQQTGDRLGVTDMGILLLDSILREGEQLDDLSFSVRPELVEGPFFS